MNDIKSLAHSKWNCKYHIVFAPKYRRQIIYGKLKAEIGKILRELCERKGVEIIEAESKRMFLKKCKSFANSDSAKQSRELQVPFPVWCTVPIAVRSCTTEPPITASVREPSSIVRFIGNTRTSAEHTSSVSPCWSEWC